MRIIPIHVDTGRHSASRNSRVASKATVVGPGVRNVGGDKAIIGSTKKLKCGTGEKKITLCRFVLNWKMQKGFVLYCFAGCA